MTTMATETVRNPSEYLAAGQRVVVTHIPSGESQTTSVTRVWPRDDYGVEFADTITRARTTLLHNGQVRSGEWLFTPLPTATEVATPTATPVGTTGFSIGEMVRTGTGREATVVGPCECGALDRERCTSTHVRIRFTESGRHQNAATRGLTRVTPPAAEVPMQHGFRVGQRVRHGYNGDATVIPHPTDHAEFSQRMIDRYVCVKLDNTDAGGFYGEGRYVYPAHALTALPQPDRPIPGVTPVPAPLTFQVGARVRLTQSVGGDAQVGDLGTVTGMRDDGTAPTYVRFDGRHGGVRGFGEHSVHVGSVELIGAPAPAPRDPAAFVVGTRVRVATQADSDARDCSNVGWPGRNEGRVGTIESEIPFGGRGTNQEQRIVRVRFDDLGSLDSVYVGNLELESSPAPAPEPLPEAVNPIEPGTEVLAGNRRGTVIDKATLTAAHQRRYRSDADIVAVHRPGYDAEGHPSVYRMHQVVLIPDTSHLTPEQQLLRFQRLVHRIASYEAVRRDWCDEVNGALAPLGLPAHLSTVDRAMGRQLQRRPDQLLVLDGEIETTHVPDVVATEDDEDDDDHYENRTFDLTLDNLSYTTDSGFTVSDASVTVRVTRETDGEYEVEDPSEWAYSDEVTDDMIRTAIREAGLPEPSRWASFEYEDGDWEEV